MPKTKLALAYFPETFRGMMATTEIRPGEDLVRVPERLLMTASRVRRATLARARAPRAGEHGSWRLSEHQALTYWVYSEAAAPRPSAWSAYIRTIPADFGSVPLSALSGDRPSDAVSTSTPAERWTAAHLPRPVARRVAEQQERLFGDWTRTRAALAAIGVAPPASWRRFVWAWLAVNTRCIHLGRPADAGGNQDTIALAPVLDMLNHSHHANTTTCYDAASGQFVIQTHRRYQKGDEVFISYGPHDNCFLLAEYGFVAACNPYQTIELDHELSAWADTAPELRASTGGDGRLVDILRHRGLWGEFTLSLDDSEPSYRLQAALRLLLAAGKRGTDTTSAVAQWERWRRGEQLSGPGEVAATAAMRQWLGRTCGEVARCSGQMVREAQEAAGASWSVPLEQQPSAEHSRPHRFLAHCLSVVWLETNRIALQWAHAT
ncbi:hypothetical protein LPJ61_004654 [Coemansia biformis]|uniref:SET domain-containing protein n=1 Tax=Coemansia biformis TaxID=1286918 RepID=A0A9W7YAC9_9FUNG|nr:hypothetical protein LPJ61_004654 [Coemansia biformis]